MGRESGRSNINAGRPMQSENPGLKCKSYILGNIENQQFTGGCEFVVSEKVINPCINVLILHYNKFGFGKLFPCR